MNSYSQHGEDVKIARFIDLLSSRDGVRVPWLVVEAGALNGTQNSNSRAFIEQGWRAILIEPHPDMKKPLIDLHGSNERVDLVFQAISDYPTPANANLYFGSIPGHSSLIPIDGADSVTVKTDTLLSTVCGSPQFTGEIGILSLDIEGLECRVLPDLINLKPYIAIVEANTAEQRRQQRKMLRPDYVEIACISVNSIYYRRDLVDFRKRYAL